MDFPRFQVIIFLLLTDAVLLTAQSNININHYTRGYGQSFRWVYDITQDEMGFIWMANHTGLRRYDGSEFITYRPINNDPNSVSTNTIVKLSSHDSCIWALGTDTVINKVDIATGEVMRIKPPEFIFQQRQNNSTRFIHFGGLSNGEFVVLFQTTDIQSNQSKASIWSYQYSKNSLEHQMDLEVGEEEILHFSERNDGKLWLWGRKKNYYLVNLQQRSFNIFPMPSQHVDDESYYELPIDENHNLWFPSINPEHSSKGLSSFSLPSHMDIASIDNFSIDNKNDIWFYYKDDIVYHYDTQKEELERFIDPLFQRSRRIQLMLHFFVDKEGGYWNGHFFGAVRFKAQEKLFDQYVYQQTGLGEQSEIGLNCRDIIDLGNNKLLVKDSDYKIYLLDRASGKMTNLDYEIPSDSRNQISPFIYSLSPSRDGRIWAIGPDAILKIDLESGRTNSIALPGMVTPSPANTKMSELGLPRLFEDSAGQLWFCHNKGLFILNERTNRLELVQVEHPPAEVGAIFEFARYDLAENKIYASYKGGVYLLNCASKSTDLIQVYTESEGFDILVSGVVRWKNAYWLATNKGLIEYNPTTNSRNIYNRRNGIASNILFGILSSDNELWLATQNGLCQFNPYTLRSNNFYTQHGLINNEFNHWSYHKASDGHLFFGGPGGVIGFDPIKFKQQSDKKGQLHLTNMTTFNERNEVLRSLRKSPIPGEKIIIHPKEKNVSFKFSITLFDAIDQNQYDYFLNGLESDWINIGNMHEVRYSHPPPGKYTFRVKAKGPDNLPALNELAIPILILQHWYLRWWAITIYILFIGYCLWVLYHYQLRQKLEKQEILRIKELDQLKTRMYTNITHEFRTPLTVILGMNDIVHQFAEKIENHKIFRAAEMIKRNGRNLLDLINQLLDLSKLQSGKLQLNYQQGNVISYLKYLMESFQSYAEEKNIQLRFSSDQNQLIMDFDKEKLNHIMSNLVSNAIKYTPHHGKVNVLVSTAAERHNHLELKITDNGQGIAPDQISKIFDRFYQGDSMSIRQVEGTGIGLYLVRELVHLLEGSIQVQSTLGEGTEFTVCLPITNHSIIVENSHLGDTSKKKFEKIEAPVVKTTSKEKDIPLLLIVEDNPDIAHYIGTALQSGYRTVFAKNGNEGIEKAIDIIPDLIISDVMMPEKDGFELCKTLKRDERTSHIPIIILTAKTNAESKIEGLELGADAYLAKPFDKKELLIRIKNLLNVRAVMQKRFSKNDFSKIIKKDTAHLDKFLIKAKDAILLNIENEDFGIPNLCKAVNISRAQLHRKLVALTGHSASHLIRSIRLEKAQELLLTRSLNISEVAYKVGFKTQAHFSRTFSEAMGITPSEFQNK